MKAKVYYQDFTLNAGILDDQIVFKPSKAILVGTVEQMDKDGNYVEDRYKIADYCFRSFNIGEGVKQITEKMVKKAGHTSMSVGDYVEFEDESVLICCAVGWRSIEAWNIYALYTGKKYTENAKKVTEAITKVLKKLISSIKMGDAGSAFISEDNCVCAAEKIKMLKIVDVGSGDTASREAIAEEFKRMLKELSFLTDEDIRIVGEYFWDVL